ncbi:ABC transporter substrate-binding protein [Microbacterium sp.]|uniref:ABC transporter substrate-binding protein n=1 Tax=Microbacterium sp. TaxID=51671 RepID=UPI0039E68907
MPSIAARTPTRALRVLAGLAALVVSTTALAGCATTTDAVEENPNYTTEPTDTFPVTVEHRYGETVVPAEPQRIVVVGVTEQDILLELGVTPIATTEWYGEQPYATWPWATDLLGDAEPVVLSQADGIAFEKIASLKPDLIVGPNAGLTQEDYDKLAAIAPTISSLPHTEAYFSDWQEQTRLVAAAVGRSEAGEELIEGVEAAYAEAAVAHPEFAGLSATFSQGAPWEGNLYVYPDGLNTDFLTELGFVMTPGLEAYAKDGEQATISAENTSLIDADVIVFATENEDGLAQLLKFGTVSELSAVKEGRAVYTGEVLSGAIYFLTPLSQKYVIDHLVPLLAEAVQGQSPQSLQE